MRERRDIHGDPATGHHRQREHTLYRDKDYGMTMADFKQGDMLGVASKSVIGVVIREFSMVDGKSASVNHFGKSYARMGCW